LISVLKQPQTHNLDLILIDKIFFSCRRKCG